MPQIEGRHAHDHRNNRTEPQGVVFSFYIGRLQVIVDSHLRTEARGPKSGGASPARCASKAIFAKLVPGSVQ